MPPLNRAFVAAVKFERLSDPPAPLMVTKPPKVKMFVLRLGKSEPFVIFVAPVTDKLNPAGSRVPPLTDKTAAIVEFIPRDTVAVLLMIKLLKFPEREVLCAAPLNVTELALGVKVVTAQLPVVRKLPAPV
jgi:hypothetical protein